MAKNGGKTKVTSKPLTTDGQAQLDQVRKAFEGVLVALVATTDVPAARLWKTKSAFTKQFAQELKGRRPDPKVAKKVRLEARLAKIQEELASLQS